MLKSSKGTKVLCFKFHVSCFKFHVPKFQLKSSKGTEVSWMFNGSLCFLISRASDIFLFTLLLLYHLWSNVKLFGETDGWPDWSVGLSMCDLLSLPACFIILSFIVFWLFHLSMCQNMYSQDI